MRHLDTVYLIDKVLLVWVKTLSLHFVILNLLDYLNFQRFINHSLASLKTAAAPIAKYKK